jgi:hypothetical protein
MAAIFMKSLSTRVSSAEISFLTIASHLNYKVYQRVDLQQTEDLALNQRFAFLNSSTLVFKRKFTN